MNRPLFRPHQGGFTLVELIVSAVLLGILASIGVSMISDSFRTAQFVNQESSSGSAARYAMERLTREIREIDPGSISTLAPTELRFTRRGTSVNIALQGNRIALDSAPVTSGSPTLVAPVSAMTLTYLTKTQTPVTSVLNVATIRFVDIDMTVAPADGRPIRLINRVALRN